MIFRKKAGAPACCEAGGTSQPIIPAGSGPLSAGNPIEGFFNIKENVSREDYASLSRQNHKNIPPLWIA